MSHQIDEVFVLVGVAVGREQAAVKPDAVALGQCARGVRKERSRVPRALLQPLTPVTVGWSGSGELATLTAVEARAAPVALIGEGLLCGLYLNELVLRMPSRILVISKSKSGDRC